ncbi:hypothetical protein RRG08_001668 [Elysia crispata]|uniref:Uncharacterized protein n=1 Tax=Elysia crispata TaxID=231223 RepID=A0AAE1AKF5_9GAST|nr:hypothetical protein RRG08_001668 [Elysia crispata]
MLVLTSTRIRRWLYHKACPIGGWCSLVLGSGAGCTTKLVLPEAGVHSSTQTRRWLYHKACPTGCWCSLVPGPGAGCTTKLVLSGAGAH